MSKHAYLIIAHNKWEQLQFLVNILSDQRNDFFLLIDAKSTDFNKDKFIQDCTNCHITFVEPVSIYWGDYSQIEAEFSLLKAATSTCAYDYYHLISAVDMPLKSQDYIHDFFEINKGAEFVDFDSYYDTSIAKSRIGYHYYFQKTIGRRKKDLLKFGRDFIVLTQKILKINRVKEFENFLGKGANWFSITDAFARYVVDNEHFIYEHFRNSYCADEVFLQTLLKMSPYKDNWYGFKNNEIQYQNLRYCDWDRGKPYTFHKEDYHDLYTNSQYLFARKFSEDIMSDEIIDILNDTLK